MSARLLINISVRMESRNSDLPLVSIIVPVYNAEPFLAETMRSILAIQYPNLEILLMDDGCSDGSMAIAREFAEQDSRIRLYSQPNQGASAARNNLIRQAQGKYILPIDADNLVEPTYVTAAVDVLEANPEVKVVTPRTDQFGLRTGEIHYPTYNIHILARKNIIDACAMYRRADWERVGGYCPEVPTREDWEFWLSMLEFGGEVVRLPNIEFHYRQHGTSKRHRMRHRFHEVIDIVNRRHPELYEREFGGPLRHARRLSSFLNGLYRLFHPRRTVLVDDASPNLLYFVRALPIHFSAGHGEVIYKRRNELRTLSFQGCDYVVKQFAVPNLLNRLVYGFLRKSKAQRSCEYARMLIDKGIDSPHPVAWQTERNGLLMGHSYYVSEKSRSPYTYADLIGLDDSDKPLDNLVEQEDHYLRLIARTVARLHEQGMIHQDLSRGNILFGDGDRVELIDLNRIRFRQVSMEDGCRNFAERLPATDHQRRIMAEAYAEARGFDAECCYQLMQQYNKEKA